MKIKLKRVVLYILIGLSVALLAFYLSDKKTIKSNEIKVTDTVKTIKIKSQKEILTRELFGPTFSYDHNFVDKYLKNRKKYLPKLKKMSIKELVYHVETLPYWSDFLKGDIYCEEIINRGDGAIAELTELILDDSTISKVNYLFIHNYFVGDVAAWIIFEKEKNQSILQKFLFDKFKIKSTMNYDILRSHYSDKLFISTKPEKSNKKNRKLLYEYIKNKKYNHPDSNKTK